MIRPVLSKENALKGREEQEEVALHCVSKCQKTSSFILYHFTACSVNLLFGRLVSSSGKLFLCLFLPRIIRFPSSDSEL